MDADLKLKLFVAGPPAQHRPIAERVSALLDQMQTIRYRFDVVDVLAEPDEADLAHILVTPTLVIRFNGSERRLVGDLSNLSGLQLAVAESKAQH